MLARYDVQLPVPVTSTNGGSVLTICLDKSKLQEPESKQKDWKPAPRKQKNLGPPKEVFVSLDMSVPVVGAQCVFCGPVYFFLCSNVFVFTVGPAHLVKWLKPTQCHASRHLE